MSGRKVRCNSKRPSRRRAVCVISVIAAPRRAPARAGDTAPQLILIGGGVSAQQALLIDPLAAQVRKSIMPAFAEGLEVRAAALQNDAGLVGAVCYFKQQRD